MGTKRKFPNSVKLLPEATSKKTSLPRNTKLVLQNVREIPLLPANLKAAREALIKKFFEPVDSSRGAKGKRIAKLGFDNIVGISVGEKIANGSPTGVSCLTVHVLKKSGESDIKPRAVIDPTVHGVPTDVLETGRIIAQMPHPVVGLYRPAAGGCSMSSTMVTRGTASCVVRIPAPGLPGGEELAFLGNNHVFAGCNSVKIDDWIIQPSPQDGGLFPLHALARLRDYVKLDFDPNAWNEVDCAVAAARSQDCVSGVVSLGLIKKTTMEPQHGRQVAKYGVATGLTYGVIQDENVVDWVDYGGQSARFRKLFKIVSTGIGPFSAGGDSGSLVVDVQTRRPVGLIVGGDLAFSYGCRISTVLSLLRAKIF